MTSTLKKAVLIFCAVSTITFCNAQKMAHINLDSLISTMAETKTVKDVAQAYMNDLSKTALSMDGEFQAKYTDYMSKEASMSDLIKTTKQEELRSMQTRLQDFKAQAQQDYQKKQAELTAPIYDKAKKAIEIVAKEGSYRYVLDTSTGTVLFSEASEDITTLVKKKLSTMPLLNIAGSSNATPKTTTPKSTTPKTGGGK